MNEVTVTLYTEQNRHGEIFASGVLRRGESLVFGPPDIHQMIRSYAAYDAAGELLFWGNEDVPLYTNSHLTIAWPGDWTMPFKVVDPTSMTDHGPLYPDIEVRLSGTDGNALSLVGKVATALERGGAGDDKVRAFSEEALSGDYDNVLRTCMKWVDVS
jgi:hypothetical protein